MVWQSTLSDTERTELGLSDPPLSKCDVAIVGGGIAGLATAYFLAIAGVPVQVFERGQLGDGVTGASLGGIWPNHDALRSVHDSTRHELAHRSRDLWARLTVRPEFRTDWRVTGLLDITAESHAAAERTAAAILEQGGSATAVDAGQIVHLEPALKPVGTAGWHFPSEAHVNPLKALLSFARAARKAGARISTSTEVTGAEIADGRVSTLHTAHGDVEPQQVVLATSFALDWASGWLPALPIRPVSGQVIASDPQPPLLRAAVQWQRMIVQLRTGQIVVGADSVDEFGQDIDPAVTADFVDTARSLATSLESVAFPHAWRGVRAMTPDGWPIVDRLENVANVWLTLGHSRRGLLLGPILGQLLAQSVREGRLVDELQMFRASRFVEDRAAIPASGGR